MTKLSILLGAVCTVFTLASSQVLAEQKLKVATFNVSMEALNYLDTHDRSTVPPANTLTTALRDKKQQVKNIAEIIQRVNPDIIFLNEFDNQNNNNASALNTFIRDYLNVSQNGQAAIDFPYFYQAPVNTGVNSQLDLDNNGKKGVLPGDAFGYGFFAGHYSMALLSKYPIDTKAIRNFQLFKWSDMPNALKPVIPETNTPWFTDDEWQQLRLSSKSHWDVPVNVNGQLVHILASHPTPPVFDGPEDRNGKRNHDEIRFWLDYITPNQSDYIYDDNGVVGGLAVDSRFVLVGDQNASLINGNALPEGIGSLLHSEFVQDPKPTSLGGAEHKPESENSKYLTAHWGMRADYVLPSKYGFTINNSGVFWPRKSDDQYRLVKDRSASSDHRLVWVELTLK